MGRLFGSMGVMCKVLVSSMTNDVGTLFIILERPFYLLLLCNVNTIIQFSSNKTTQLSIPVQSFDLHNK